MMRTLPGIPSPEACLRAGVLLVVLGMCLLGGAARAEESKEDVFGRWLKAIVVGAPEAGLKAMAEFKRSESGGVVDYEARVQDMSCRAAVENGKVRGAQILAFKDRFPEEATRKKIEKLYGITFPEPQNVMGDRNYRIIHNGLLITFGVGANGTTFNVGRDPNAQPEGVEAEDSGRIDYLGTWFGKVLPANGEKTPDGSAKPGAAAAGKVTLVLMLSVKSKGYIIVFAPDRDLDPSGAKGLTKGHMMDGTWQFKAGVVTFTPNPESFPAEKFPDLRPLKLSVSKPAEDKVEVSLADFASAGLPLPAGDFKITLREATPKEDDLLLEKLKNNVRLVRPRQK